MDKEAIIREYMAHIGSVGGSRKSERKTAANKIKARLPRKKKNILVDTAKQIG